VTVDWVGPGGKGDTIQLFDPTAKQGEGALVRERRLVNEDFDNRKVRIIVPTEPGFYQLRYWNRDDRKVLATRQIEVLPAEVSLSAPASVDMARPFMVSWVGPGAIRDSIELYDPDGDNGNGKFVTAKRLINGDTEARTVTLIAPTEPGDYELRYRNGDDNVVLATRPIEVVAMEVSVAGPEAVDMGRPFDVNWVGPGAVRDSIELYDPDGDNGNGKFVTAKRLINGDTEARTVTLIAPTEPGDYELRYRNGDDNVVLATAPISVVATAVSISGPESIEMGRTFEVSWVGPGSNRDAAEVFDPEGDNGNGKVVYSKRLVNDDMDHRTVKLIAPIRAKTYQLRYLDGMGRKVLATAAIEVVATDVAIMAPDAVPAGEMFTVEWAGPGAYRDSIDVIAGDPEEGKVLASARVVNGDLDARTVKVRAPKQPGEHTLRYWNGEFREVLATRPITVE